MGYIFERRTKLQMELTNNNLSQTLLPGQRLIKANGYEAAEKYPMPRDCEAAIFDEAEDYCYIKKTDTNGGVILLRYRMEEDPIPHFDPKKYVTVDDFSKFKEDILNGFNDLRQVIAESSTSSAGYTKPNSKQSGKPNNGVSQS